MRACAAAAFVQRKDPGSHHGGMRPARKAARPWSDNCAAIAALAASDWGRSVEPVIVSRRNHDWRSQLPTSRNPAKSDRTSRPSSASGRTLRANTARPPCRDQCRRRLPCAAPRRKSPRVLSRVLRPPSQAAHFSASCRRENPRAEMMRQLDRRRSRSGRNRQHWTRNASPPRQPPRMKTLDQTRKVGFTQRRRLAMLNPSGTGSAVILMGDRVIRLAPARPAKAQTRRSPTFQRLTPGPTAATVCPRPPSPGRSDAPGGRVIGAGRLQRVGAVHCPRWSTLIRTLFRHPARHGPRAGHQPPRPPGWLISIARSCPVMGCPPSPLVGPTDDGIAHVAGKGRRCRALSPATPRQIRLGAALPGALTRLASHSARHQRLQQPVFAQGPSSPARSGITRRCAVQISPGSRMIHRLVASQYSTARNRHCDSPVARACVPFRSSEVSPSTVKIAPRGLPQGLAPSAACIRRRRASRPARTASCHAQPGPAACGSRRPPGRC